jgi:thiol-disulfide isomerase/thioredoxin
MNKPNYQKVILQILLTVGLIASLMAMISRPAQAGFVAEQHPAALQSDNPVVIYFFWGNGCPHCAEAIPFIAELQQNNTGLQVQAFEVWQNEDNAKLLQQVATGFGFEAKFVPTIFIGDKSWQGFSDVIGSEMTSTIDQYMVSGDPNKAAQFLNGVTGTDLPISENPAATVVSNTPEATEVITPQATPEVTPEIEATEIPASQKEIKVPFFGTVDLSHQSVLVSTLLIALVDGFNPCSIWVLSMLLSITLHSGSRKKVLIIGLIFLTVTAAVYALFISGLFTLFKVVRFIGLVLCPGEH